MTILLAVTRWAHLLALTSLFGAAAFSWLLHRRSLPTPAASRMWFWTWLVATVSAMAQLLLTAASMSDTVSGAFDPAVLSAVLLHTLFGQLFILRAAMLVLLFPLVRRASLPFAPIALVSAVALSAITMTSHAAASGREAFMLVRATNDAVHLLTAGFWIGGLLVLLDRATKPDTNTTFAITVGLFSEVAIYAVTALALAGMINTGFIYAAQDVTRTYTLLLLLKAVLACAMVVIAFINRLRLTPALAGSGNAAFARNVRTEIMLGAGVVALAAILGSIPPG